MVQILILHKTLHVHTRLRIATQHLPLFLDEVQHPQFGFLIVHKTQAGFLLEHFVIKLKTVPVHVSAAQRPIMLLCDDHTLVIFEVGTKSTQFAMTDIHEDNMFVFELVSPGQTIDQTDRIIFVQ